MVQYPIVGVPEFVPIWGQSSGMLYGSAKPVAAQQTAKAGHKSIDWWTVGKEAYAWGKKLAPIPIAVGTYAYLTQEVYDVPSTSPTYKAGKKESLIGRGARQFGESYFGSGPMSYYEGQKQALPLTKELEADLYQQYAPSYQQVAIENIYSEALAKAQAYQAMQPYYNSDIPITNKSTTKMPYNTRII